MAGLHLAPRLIPALIFAAATVLTLLSLSWPPLSQSIAIVCVVALLVRRFTICFGGVLVVDLIGLPRVEEERQVSPLRSCPGRRSHCSGTGAVRLSSSFTFGWAIIQSMMTKPGEQFVIRRNALAMIRNAFQENGIEFAVPTVQVAERSRRGG